MKFIPASWSAEAVKGLGTSLGNDAEFFHAQVNSGSALLWRSTDGKSWMITRREGNEMVLCCYAGRSVRLAFRYFLAWAKREGCSTVRFHTLNPWLLELASEFNPDPVEYVMRVQLYGR